MAVSKETNRPRWVGRAVRLGVAVLAFIVIVNLPVAIPPLQLRVLAIVVVAAILWFSEALPLFVTSLLVPVLLAFSTDLKPEQLFTPFFDPIVALFFASFVLAVALSKYELDHKAAAFAFRILGNSSRKLLLGLMIVVALIGMWLTNTATVAFMLPIFLLLIRTNKLETRAPNLMKSMLLGLAVATSLDGLATIIGTPPNAIAVKFLAEQGITIDFFDWMKFGIPITFVMLPLAWLILIAVFPPEIKKLKPVVLEKNHWSRQQLATLAILLGVLALWITQPLHGINTAVIGLMGVVFLYVTGLLKLSDLNKVSFATLILFGGGLVLGEAMIATGVTDLIAGVFVDVVGQQSEPVLLISVMGLAAVLTAFASNTAVAALLIPIIVSIASATGLAAAPLVLGTTLALSIDVISPVGTPPSAMVYGTGRLRVADFLRAGFLITIIGLLVVFAAVSWLVAK